MEKRSLGFFSEITQQCKSYKEFEILQLFITDFNYHFYDFCNLCENQCYNACIPDMKSET